MRYLGKITDPKDLTTKEYVDAVEAQLDDKADKVSGATENNFAGLDANGNIKDSGSKASDFAQASHTHTPSQVGLGNVGNFKAVSTVANQGLTDAEKSNARTNIGAGTSSFSGDYNDLTNKPTIPTVNDATLTVQKNGTTVATFTANSATNKTANIEVPTKVSELTNDSGYTTNEGTVTSVAVKMNGSVKGTVTTSGTIDLGTVITSHQDISGKANINSPTFTGTPCAPTATAGTNTTQIATTAFVKTAIDNIPAPMVFKGTLGTGGTITDLPVASASNTGHVYKVITAGTYQGIAAKVGDTFVSTGTEWILIPSGDEPSGTVTNVGTGTGLTGGPITSSGTISLDTSYTATSSRNGLMPSGDKSKLDGISATKLSATASGAAVGADGTATVLTGVKASSTDTVLGTGTVFTTTVNPTTTNIKATASGGSVSASGTATFLKGVKASSTDAVLGTGTTFTTSVTPATTNVKATASGGSVSASGTATFLKGVKVSSTDNVLGESTVFTTTVTPTTTNIKATASGTAVAADGTDTFIKSYPGTSSKLSTVSIGSASGWNAGSLPTLGTAISADDITSWSAGSHSASIQSTVLTGASVSGGTLSISSGSQSHSYTAPSLSYTAKTIPNVTGVGSLPSLTVTSQTVATGSLASDATGATVMTGLGTASTGSALTGVKITAQPTVALSTGATTATGVISVATGITSATTTAGAGDIVAAATAVAADGTGTGVTGIGAMTQPTITLATGATAGTGVISLVNGISSASTTAATSGTGSDVVTAITGVAADGTDTGITGIGAMTQPTISLSTGATAGSGVINVATGINSATTTAATSGTGSDVVSAVTGVGSNGTATALTGVKVTTQPTITIASGATGDVQVAKI